MYEYLELRFDRRVRYFMSAVFLVSRGLSTGVGIYASAIVLEVCLGIPLWANILLIGVVTVLYDTIGGMTAVVYSAVIQMAVLLGGLIVCIVIATDVGGGVEATLAALPVERWNAVELGTGLGDGSRQWIYLGLPVYTFRHDGMPGDTNGDKFGTGSDIRGGWNAILKETLIQKFSS